MTKQELSELEKALRIRQDDVLTSLAEPTLTQAELARRAREAERLYQRISELEQKLQEAQG